MVHIKKYLKKKSFGSIFIVTKNILIIALGAFDGLENIIAERLSKKQIGFGNENNKVKAEDKLIHQVTHEDLEKYGLIREILGRLHVIVTFDELQEEQLTQILTEPKNSLVKQYQQLMKYDNINLDFNDEAIKKISHLAAKRKTGARSLRSIMETSLMNLMYKLPNSKTKQYTVTEKDIVER